MKWNERENESMWKWNDKPSIKCHECDKKCNDMQRNEASWDEMKHETNGNELNRTELDGIPQNETALTQMRMQTNKTMQKIQTSL